MCFITFDEIKKVLYFVPFRTSSASSLPTPTVNTTTHTRIAAAVNQRPSTARRFCSGVGGAWWVCSSPAICPSAVFIAVKARFVEDVMEKAYFAKTLYKLDLDFLEVKQ